MNGVTCETCRFFEKDEYSDLIGLCKRYPKVLTKAASNWCGEHETQALELLRDTITYSNNLQQLNETEDTNGN